MSRLSVMGLVLAATAGMANASIVGNALVITASSPRGTGTYVVPGPGVGSWDRWSYNARQIELRDSSGALVGRLDGLDMEVDMSSPFTGFPIVTINFTTVAGGVDTAFSFTSGELVFAPFTNAIASASAGYSFTDRNGNGASVTGAFAGGATYRADFNGLVPAGTAFATLAPSASFATPFGTQVVSGFNSGIIPGVVSSISAEFSFTLSANDSIGGTSVYQLIPTPGAVAVLGLAGLVVARRRRA